LFYKINLTDRFWEYAIKHALRFSWYLLSCS